MTGQPQFKKLAQFIKSERNKKRMSVRALALKSGLSAPYVSRLENNLITNNIKVETLNKLAYGLSTDRNELYTLAGYNNVKDEVDLEKMIDSGEYMSFGGQELSDEDKELIKRLLRK